MDLSSSGTKVILLFTLLVVSYGQIYIEEGEDASFQHENSEEGDEQRYRVSGDIYVVDRLKSENVNAVYELFENIIETDSEVFVKISGNSLSIVTESSELIDVLKHAEIPADNGKSMVNDQGHDMVIDLLEVLQVAEKYVHIYIITEEGSAVKEGIETLMKQIIERDIRIDILQLQGDDGLRHKRQINFYQLLANISGGSVINTNKQNIGSALNLLKQSIKTSLVHIMRFSDHSPAGKEFRIPVDDTMTQFIFRAQVERSNPVIIAMTPAGIPPPSHPQLLGKASAGTVVGLLETNLTKSTDYGTWKITKLDFNLWDIKVDGQSPIDFTHEFLEPGSGGFGEYPIKGRPIIGNTYKLSISVPEYAKVQTVRMGMMFTRERLMPIDMKPLKNVGGRRGKSMFYEQFTIPNKDFMIGIEGRDKSGHMFRRIDPILITPVGLKLVIPSLSGVKFYQNDTLAIPFTVINQGSKQQDVDVRIEDDKKFAQPPSTLSATIKPGQNFTGTFVIRAGLTVGETTTATITAKPYLGHGIFSQGQFEIRRFTVIDKNITTTTLTTPTTSTTSTASTSTTITPSTTATTSTLTSVTSAPTSASTKTSTTPTTARTTARTVAAVSTVNSTNRIPTTKGSPTTSVPGTTTKSTPMSGPTISSYSSAHSVKTPVSTGTTVTKSTGAASSFISTVSTSTVVLPTTSQVTATTAKPSTIQKSTTAFSTTPKMTTGTARTSTTTTKTTAGTSERNNSKNSNLPTTSIVVGVTTGAVVGIAAIGTMALLFRRAMLKTAKSVGPNTAEKERKRRQSNLAWT